MTSPNWNLLNLDTFHRSFQQGMAMGEAAREAGERREYRNALAALATNPEDQTALQSVFQYDPRTGVALMERAETRAFGRDTAEFFGSDDNPNGQLGMSPTNALAGLAPAPPRQQGNALAAYAPVQPGASFDEAFTPVTANTPQTRQDAPEREDAGPDLSMLGEPSTGRDRAFLRMVRRDPIKALKIKSSLRDNFIEQVKAEGEFYGLAMGELSRATDQVSWDAAMQAVLPRAQALGMDLARVVPASYPGGEGVAELMKRAQPIKDQLDLMVREANIEADNVRADRNTDSLIETRDGRLDEYRRANLAREDNTRRGQDLTDARGRRGQDIASGDRQRGQNITSRDRVRGQGARVVEVQKPEDVAKLTKGTFYRTPDGQVFEVE